MSDRKSINSQGDMSDGAHMEELILECRISDLRMHFINVFHLL